MIPSDGINQPTDLSYNCETKETISCKQRW